MIPKKTNTGNKKLTTDIKAKIQVLKPEFPRNDNLLQSIKTKCHIFDNGIPIAMS